MARMSDFANRLHAAIQKKNTPALVGLDPRWESLPPSIIKSAQTTETDPVAVVAKAFEEFCLRVIDVVAPLVPAVKPQSAFFEQYGPQGVAALGRVIAYARKNNLITILDAKRGDIGSTAEAYATGLIGGADPAHPWQADALTVSPYLGADTLDPFVRRASEVGGGIYVLVRTSNPGAGTFQDISDGKDMLFARVSHTVEELAERTSGGQAYGCVGAVVGATYPDELKRLRSMMPHTPLLIPGYGSQGGTAEDVASAFDSQGLGALINNSRGINFAFRTPDYRDQFGESHWEAATEAATRKMIADLGSVMPR